MDFTNYYAVEASVLRDDTAKRMKWLDERSFVLYQNLELAKKVTARRYADSLWFKRRVLRWSDDRLLAYAEKETRHGWWGEGFEENYYIRAYHRTFDTLAKLHQIASVQSDEGKHKANPIYLTQSDFEKVYVESYYSTLFEKREV